MELCEVGNKCLLNHKLLQGDHFNLVTTILSVEPPHRAKLIISLLESKQPPKVSSRDVEEYKAKKRRRGYDSDKKKNKSNGPPPRHKR